MKDSFPSTHKKVVIRKLDRSLVKGYVKPGEYLGPKGVEILDLEGHFITLPLEEIKGIYFVREFDGSAEYEERKIFKSRPRLSGLWIRMTFKDSEVLDGLVSGNLLELDARGFSVAPPDVYSNNLKIFVPRTALETVQVLGVISNGARRHDAARELRLRKPEPPSAQIGLFNAEPEVATNKLKPSPLRSLG